MKLFYYNENKNVAYDIVEEKISQNAGRLKNNSDMPGCKNNNRRQLSRYVLRFKSPLLTGIPGNDDVYGEYIDESGKKNKKCIILLHGFKSINKRLDPYYAFAKQAVENQFGCFFIHLPFHLKRTPPSKTSGEVLLDNDDEGMFRFFHQAVVDIKKAINIIKKEFKTEEFFICGLSLGGMCSVFAKAFEKRIKKAVLLQCGGNWHEIYWNSFLSKIILKGRYLRIGKIEKETSRQFYERFPEFIYGLKEIYNENPRNFCSLKEIEDSGLKCYLKPSWFLSDPLAWAHRIKREEVLMISARFDPLFNKNTILQLKKELGQPKIIWINRFHTASVLKNRKINSIIFNYLNESRS